MFLKSVNLSVQFQKDSSMKTWQKTLPSLLFILTITTSCSKNDNNPTTKDDSVTIGTQKWMKKNLDVDHYRNGDPIPQVQDATQWAELTTGAWCYYGNDPNNGNLYGKLYNWYAVNDPRGLAPQEWHIPVDSEWGTLSEYLGGDSFSGGELKSTTGWNIPNIGATNSAGFTALPGGARTDDGAFFYIGFFGYWWTASEMDSNNAKSRSISSNNSSLTTNSNNKFYGCSVRCVKD